MDVRFKKDISSEYMIIEQQVGAGQSNYEMQVLHNNQIPGLLRFNMKKENGIVWCYYDIKHTRSIVDISDFGGIEYEDAVCLIQCIGKVMEKLEEYLLSYDAVCLDERYVYKDIKTNAYVFAYISGYEKNLENQLKDLLAWLMKHINYNDKHCVSYVFELYRRLENGENIFESEHVHSVLATESQAFKEAEVHKEEHKVHASETDQYMDSSEIKTSSGQDEEDKTILNMALNLKITGACMVLFVISLLMKDTLSYWFRLYFGIYPYQWIWPVITGLCSILANIVCIIFVRIKSEHKDDFWREDQKIDFQAMKANETVVLKNDAFDSRTQLLNTNGIILVGQSVGCTDTICVSAFPFTIGKNEALVQFVINDRTVSRRHLQINFEQGQYYVTDLYSTNGTKINGSSLSPGRAYEIHIGDRLQISEFIFEMQSMR